MDLLLAKTYYNKGLSWVSILTRSQMARTSGLLNREILSSDASTNVISIVLGLDLAVGLL